MSTATLAQSSPVRQSMDLTCINTIRTLSMDAVQAANSGHPGTPMAMAPVAYCLWQEFLRIEEPVEGWFERAGMVFHVLDSRLFLPPR